MIFLYRGELHKVSGVTRQWPLPKPSISLSAFRQALEKRNDAVRRTSSVVPTPYLTRQDTCVSHNVSPAQQQLRSREDAETEIGREGRGESDHMDLEDSFLGQEEDMEVRDDHEPLEDHKERKKRKREEASIEVSKGKVKVEVKEEVVSVKVEVTEEVAVKVEDEMDLDHKVEETTRAPSVEKDEGDPMAMDEAKLVPLQGDFVKVEAPSTPPVHSEEMNTTLKPVEGKDHVEEANATDEKEAVKADLEAKLKKLTAEKHRLVQMLKQVQSTEEKSKKKVQSASQSPSALVPPPPAPQAPTAFSIELPAAATDTAEVVEQKVVVVDTPSSTAQLVRPNRFGRQSNSSSRHTTTTSVQVLSTEEESKKKTVAASQSSPAPGTDVPAPEAAAEAPQPPSADLEEGELEYARTPSPPSSHATTTTTGSHAASHGQHSHGSTPALGPLLGRQPPHLNQGGSARGSYYQQGMSLPSPSSAAALAGAISPGTGFMPLALGGRPFQQHMVMQHAAAMHAQKVAAGHSHMSPILGGGGPAGAGNGVNNGPPGFGGYGVSPSVHGHHGHMSQGPSPGAGQQGVASPSLLTTPRGAGYHGMNTPWNMQR